MIISPPPPTVTNSSAETRSDDSDSPWERPDPDPEEDCNCYLSVTHVSNGTGDPGMELWQFVDIVPPGSSDHVIFGKDQTWTPFVPNGPYMSLPSDPYPVNNGPQSFYVTYDESATGFFPNFTIHAQVKCYLVYPDGTEELATTTYHPFDISEGVPSSSGVGWDFAKTFSCGYLSSDDPK